ncbi:MAG: hypothetical protein H0V76_07775 [Blastocatellia bacterium]|nr:hypothetical protein [Blastocatellia bacterium]
MKRFIQFLSVISLAMVFGVAGVFAQAGTRLEAEIPFDFMIGDKSFSAGSYTLSLAPARAGVTTFDLKDAKGRVIHSAHAMSRGFSAKGKSVLVFNNDTGDSRLERIITPDVGLGVSMGRSSKALAQKRKVDSKETIVTIN